MPTPGPHPSWNTPGKGTTENKFGLLIRSETGRMPIEYSLGVCPDPRMARPKSRVTTRASWSGCRPRQSVPRWPGGRRNWVRRRRLSESWPRRVPTRAQGLAAPENALRQAPAPAPESRRRIRQRHRRSRHPGRSSGAGTRSWRTRAARRIGPRPPWPPGRAGENHQARDAGVGGERLEQDVGPVRRADQAHVQSHTRPAPSAGRGTDTGPRDTTVSPASGAGVLVCVTAAS